MTEQRQTGKRPPSSLRTLEAGSHYRCLAQDGESPCSGALSDALEADRRRAANFTPEERARAQAARAERFRKRQMFWDGFAAAFALQAGRGGAARGRIAGDLWFDPRTFEIVRMEYRRTADGGEPVSRMSKGTTFAMTTAPAAEGRNLPFRSLLHDPSKAETRSYEFANYRRFTAGSTVDFTGPDKP
jgi:hypothetical protein